MNNFCRYFQAYVQPLNCFFVVAVVKAEANVAFVRTFDVEKSILEFFVPHETTDQFQKLIDRLIHMGYISYFVEIDNRYASLTEL